MHRSEWVGRWQSVCPMRIQIADRAKKEALAITPRGVFTSEAEYREAIEKKKVDEACFVEFRYPAGSNA